MYPTLLSQTALKDVYTHVPRYVCEQPNSSPDRDLIAERASAQEPTTKHWNIAQDLCVKRSKAANGPPGRTEGSTFEFLST